MEATFHPEKGEDQPRTLGKSSTSCSTAEENSNDATPSLTAAFLGGKQKSVTFLDLESGLATEVEEDRSPDARDEDGPRVSKQSTQRSTRQPGFAVVSRVASWRPRLSVKDSMPGRHCLGMSLFIGLVPSLSMLLLAQVYPSQWQRDDNGTWYLSSMGLAALLFMILIPYLTVATLLEQMAQNQNQEEKAIRKCQAKLRNIRKLFPNVTRSSMSGVGCVFVGSVPGDF